MFEILITAFPGSLILFRLHCLFIDSQGLPPETEVMSLGEPVFIKEEHPGLANPSSLWEAQTGSWNRVSCWVGAVHSLPMTGTEAFGGTSMTGQEVLCDMSLNLCGVSLSLCGVPCSGRLGSSLILPLEHACCPVLALYAFSMGASSFLSSYACLSFYVLFRHHFLYKANLPFSPHCTIV